MSDADVPPVVQGLMAAALDMTDVELLMVLGTVLTVLGKRMGMDRLKSSVAQALKTIEAHGLT